MITSATTQPASPREMEHHYFLVASQCDAQKELSLSMFAQQIIDLSVDHANALDVGYSRLKSIGALWVLSRITVAMKRMPRIEEHYNIITWVESFHRMFSHRNFVVFTPGGEVLGYVRTLWVGIDMESRRPADLSGLVDETQIISPRECRMPQPAKLREFKEASDIDHYRFQVTDIDFNRHVNSTRYIELILNQWSLDFNDRHRITYFDIAYKHEAHYGERTAIRIVRDDTSARLQLDGENHCYCLAEIKFAPR